MKKCFSVSMLYWTLHFISCSLYPGVVHASESDTPVEDNMQWDLGFGAGVFNYKLYPGASNSHRFVIPAPYFTFRSPKLEIDRGIRGFLYSSESFVLDISADFGLPADSEDTVARQGMPDLDFMLQLGPSFEFLLNDASKSYFDIRFEIAARAAFTTDLRDVDSTGYILEPRFSFNHPRQSRTGVTQKATFGLKYASEAFNDYYYEVAADYATATRPAYDSEAGFGGSFIKYNVSYKTSNVVYWVFIHYQSLRGAVFEDSPLVLQKDYYLIGLGASWLFAGSL